MTNNGPTLTPLWNASNTHHGYTLTQQSTNQIQQAETLMARLGRSNFKLSAHEEVQLSTILTIAAPNLKVLNAQTAFLDNLSQQVEQKEAMDVLRRWYC